jgi:DNA-binding winged helix-turn-helix (wHTH) protein
MTPLRFFDFELDPSTGDLRRRGHTVPLERQPALALACLAGRAGRLVTRDELRRAIWPDDVHVDFDRGMNYCIRQLRAALGDEARHPVFIETVPRQGYRFIAPIQQHTSPAARTAAVRRGAGFAGAILLAVVTLTSAAVWDAAVASADAKTHHHAVAVAAARAVHDFLF